MDNLYCSYYILEKYNHFSHKYLFFTQAWQKCVLFICMYNFIYSFAINVQISSTNVTFWMEQSTFYWRCLSRLLSLIMSNVSFFSPTREHQNPWTVHEDSVKLTANSAYNKLLLLEQILLYWKYFDICSSSYFTLKCDTFTENLLWVLQSSF